MKGFYVRFFMQESRKHQGVLLYEWLIEKAKKMGIRGCTVLRGIAGFGKDSIVHEEHFFELASELPIEVTFVISEEELNRLFDVLKQEKLDLFYVKMVAEFGVLN